MVTTALIRFVIDGEGESALIPSDDVPAQIAKLKRLGYKHISEKVFPKVEKVDPKTLLHLVTADGDGIKLTKVDANTGDKIDANTGDKIDA